MQDIIKFVLFKIFYLKFIFIVLILFYMPDINALAQNDNTNFISFENDSDFNYFIEGKNDGFDYNNGYGADSKKRSLKLSDANCVESSWTKSRIIGSGNLNFMTICEHDFAAFFELIVYVDGEIIKSVNCNQLAHWGALDSPIRIRNSDDNSHELKLELKYNSLSNECNIWYPRLTLWLDNIVTTGSLKFIMEQECPGMIKEGDINSTIIETIKECNEIRIEKGTRLQNIFDIIESMQKIELLPEKIFILDGGEYPGPVKISNLKKITIKNNDDDEAVFSGQNTSIEVVNSSEISLIGLNFGRSENHSMLIKTSKNCLIENNKIKGFKISGLKIINCNLNKIYSNRLQSSQKTVDGICVYNSTANDLKSNSIYVDNFSYAFINKSYDNEIIYVDHGEGCIIMDNELIFEIKDGIPYKDGITTFDPNQESHNKWRLGQS